MTWVRAAAAVAARPSLWGTALRQVRRLGVRPDPGYLRFRAVTQYGGDGDASPEPADVVSYLTWLRQWHRVVG